MTEKASVLVVDDNADLLETFSMIFKRYGYSVDTAADGLAAMDKFKARPFDIILMDVIMPRMDGVEAFRRMREMNPGARVVLMTAYHEEEQLKKTQEEGVYGTLYKPVNLAHLMELIRRATEGLPVLIVDDNIDFCKTMAQALELEGYRVDIALNGEDAIKIAKAREFQIAFIDIKMPLMDGLDTCIKLKEINSGFLGVMMTAYRNEVSDIVERALISSAATCLYKPFRPSEAIYWASLVGGK